ncbi:hypothetical protein RHGRI_037036 [Rhododendron griersonianum]|uniref:Protein kinase domain-containing protein n=1 Tax=Rhododendron griersonianum TaxID=479676 RepID=A0AAV6HQT0_9ERIC|nr:hypothetical protein RHGRI_037036 [Rhododendron griersonianum]
MTITAVKLRMLADDPTATKSWPSSIFKNDSNNSGLSSSSSNAQGGMGFGNFQSKKAYGKAQVSTLAPQRKDTTSGLGSKNMSQSSLAVVRKKRVHAQDFNAKLSDFGLARTGPTGDNTHVSTRVVGTRGYAAPEYVAIGHLTPKSDVYSYGVVLLELLSGRRAMGDDRPGSVDETLVDWAKLSIGTFYHLSKN